MCDSGKIGVFPHPICNSSKQAMPRVESSLQPDQATDCVTIYVACGLVQCAVCDTGNWCFSPSHYMTDCVDVLFYRQ